MHLIYIDDSRDEQLCVFSAMAIPSEHWRAAFDLVRGFRKNLKKTDGILVTCEFHAWKFVSGRGRLTNEGFVSKYRRCQIFNETLELITRFPQVQLFNAVFPAKDEERAFERLLNRINKNMEVNRSEAMLVCDEGKDAVYTRLVRKMGVYNPILSRFGSWHNGERRKNIPIHHIIEDPVFKRSDRSYFIQLADFCAFALLRRERPTDKLMQYNLHQSFDILSRSKALVRKASLKDAEGIIRP